MPEARREALVAGVVLATSTFFFLYLWQSTDQRLGASSPTTMPLVVTGAIMLLSVILLARNLARLWAASREDGEETTTVEAAGVDTPSDASGVQRGAAGRGIALVAWTVLYLAALPWLGYLLTTSVFIGGLSYLFGNRSVVTIVLLMVITPVALHLFFERYMVILLPSGSLFS